MSALEDKKIACCILLDFAKAFDTVNHNILLRELENFGIRGIPLDWFKSYLNERKQIVKINNVKSATLTIKCGVPQGSVLGPLLFLIYINDIHRVSELLNFHLFADDTSLLFSHREEQVIEGIVNQELKQVNNWLIANKLSLNVSKSSLLVFHPPQKKLKQINIQINGLNIPLKEKAKYLGIILDENFIWHAHVQYINIKLSRAIGILSKLRHSLPTQMLRALFFSFFQPHIEYCINIWTCAPKTALEPIEISMQKAIRIISFAKRDSHSAPLFKVHNILNFQNLCKLNLGKLVGPTLWQLSYIIKEYPTF